MPKPAKLPKGAPKSLRDFVACRANTVTLDTATLNWIPTPRGVPKSFAPDVTVTPGATPTTGTITVGYGEFISIDLPVSIDANGKLVVDASKVGLGIGPEIDKWVANFNATMASNGKQLAGFKITGKKVALTKKPVVVAKEPAGGATPTPTPGVSTPESKPEPAPKQPAPKKPVPGGCLAWILAAVVGVVTLGTIAFITLGGDDGDDDTLVSTDADASQTAPPSSAPTPTPTSTSTTPTPSAPAGDPEPTPSSTNNLADAPPAVPTCVDIGMASLTPYGSFDLPTGACTRSGPTSPPPCDDAGPWCLAPGRPPVALNGTTGTDHGRTVIDVATDDQSASTGESNLYFQGPAGTWPSSVDVVLDCGGTTKTGRADVTADGTERADLPLQFFGPCAFDPVRFVGGDRDGYQTMPAGPTDYLVDGNEPDPGDPDLDRLVLTSDRFEIEPSWPDATGVIHQTIAGDPVDQQCIWFFDHGDVAQIVKVLDSCSQPGSYWVFAGGLTDVQIGLTVVDTVVGTTATFTTPPVDAITDTGAFDTLYDNTVFPCGTGFIAETVCPIGEPAMAAGGLVTVSAAFAAPVPLVDDGAERAHLVDFSANGGPTYTLRHEPDGWTIESSSGSTRARALIRDNSITLVAPDDELSPEGLSYTWRTEVDGTTAEHPDVPVVGRLTVPAIPAPVSEPPPDESESSADADGDGVASEDGEADDEIAATAEETLDDFYAQLSASVAAGDAGFSLERLDPRVFEVYPDSCPAALASFADPDLVIEFLEEGPFEPWTYEADGQSIEIPDAVTVTIRLTGRGQSGEPGESHLTIIDGRYRWFTFC